VDAEIFFLFVALDRKHGCVSKHAVFFSKLTFMNFYKKLTNKSRRTGSKLISFVCSMTSQVTFTFYPLLNSLVNC